MTNTNIAVDLLWFQFDFNRLLFAQHHTEMFLNASCRIEIKCVFFVMSFYELRNAVGIRSETFSD